MNFTEFIRFFEDNLGNPARRDDSKKVFDLIKNDPKTDTIDYNHIMKVA